MTIHRWGLWLSVVTLGLNACEIEPSLSSETSALYTCNALANPYNACTVADGSDDVSRAALQFLIEKARRQYDAQIAGGGPALGDYLKPIVIELPDALTYTLDGPLHIGPGVQLLGTGSSKPRLVSSGDTLDLEAWQYAAVNAAVGFTPPSGVDFLDLGDDIHVLACNAANNCQSRLTDALNSLDERIEAARIELCPDTTCSGDYRYFDVLKSASIWLNRFSDPPVASVAFAGADGGFNTTDNGFVTGEYTRMVLPAYSRLDEVGDIRRTTADPVIIIESDDMLGSGAAARMQAKLQNIAVECAPGPYYPLVAPSASDGFGTIGILINSADGGANTTTAANDVEISDVEVDGCVISIHAVNGQNVTFADNTLVTGVRLGEPLYTWDGTTYDRLTVFAEDVEWRNSGDNGIRIHGTIDRGYRVEGNTIGRLLPEEEVPVEGPGRGIHIHGTSSTTSSRADFDVRDNIILWAQDAGLHFQGKEDRIRVTDNEIDHLERVYPPYQATLASRKDIVFIECVSGAGDCPVLSGPTNWIASGNDGSAGDATVTGGNSVAPHRYCEWASASIWTSGTTLTPCPVGDVTLPTTCGGTSSVLVKYPKPHHVSGPPVLEEIQVGRMVRFVPPPPAFSSGCPANAAPQYKLWMNDGSWRVLKDYTSDAAMEWTPLSTGTYTFQLWMKAAESAAAYDSTSIVPTINVVSNLTPSTITCPAAHVAFTCSAYDGDSCAFYALSAVKNSDNSPIACSGDTSPLEYIVYSRRVGDTGGWSLVRGWGPAAVTYWDPNSVDADTYSYHIQIWYRRQGSNATSEGTTAVATSP